MRHVIFCRRFVLNNVKFNFSCRHLYSKVGNWEIGKFSFLCRDLTWEVRHFIFFAPVCHEKCDISFYLSWFFFFGFENTPAKFPRRDLRWGVRRFTSSWLPSHFFMFVVMSPFLVAHIFISMVPCHTCLPEFTDILLYFESHGEM